MFKGYTISNQIILPEAAKRGIKIRPLYKCKMVELEYKGHVEYMFNQFISKTTAVAFSACERKEITKVLLNDSGISVPKGKVFNSRKGDEAFIFAKEIGYPVVMKPTNSSCGKGVFSSITGDAEFLTAWEAVSEKFDTIIIEKRFEGTEYRIVASDEKVLAVTNRVPANIIGDGNSTIQRLIEIKNSDRRRGDDSYSNIDTPLVKIEIDDFIKANLLKKGLALDSIPETGEQIFLRENSNLSTGGDSIDFTDKVHPSVKEIAIKTIRAIPGLAYGGIDFISKDITKPQTKEDYVIIEINTSPGIFMHHFPYEGTPRDVASDIIDLAFPETKKG